MRIDLHTHSTASDGTLSPSALVEQAFKEGIGYLSITDHDTVAGLTEAMAKAEQLGIEVVPGVELSVDHDGHEMHILGYYFQPDKAELTEVLDRMINFRNERNPLMIQKLQSLGISISLEEVQRAANGRVVGRPHFAKVLVEKGIVATVAEAFDTLLTKGKPAYVPKEKMGPEEGLRLLAAAGAIPVLAHPIFLPEKNYNQMWELLKRLKGYGLEGIEAYYPAHPPEAVQCYTKLAKELGLILTGGSDYHGENKTNRLGWLNNDGGAVPSFVRDSLKGLAEKKSLYKQ